MTLEKANSEAAKEMRNAGERAQALYNQWADAFSTALENSTSGQTDVKSDVQLQARKKYWYPNMSANELSYVKRLAKHEVETNDNYIDSDTKWLYNTKDGNVYFALYSTAETNDPTILYACKNARAEFEHDFLKEYISEGANINGDVDSRTKIVNAILKNYQNVNRAGSIHSGNAVGRGSNNGDVAVYSRNKRRRPSNAFIDCLENIEEIRKQREQSDSVNNSARPQRDSEGNELTEAQQEYFKDSKVRDKDGNLLVVRHGTDADFNVFDFSKSGKNGKAEGYGFYFSDDPEITNKYGAKQKEVYLNITKPLYNNKRTINKAELIKLTNALIDFDVEKYKDEGLTWQDSFLSNYVMTYDMTRQSAVREFVNQIWNYNTTDQDLVFEIAQGDGRYYDGSTMKEFYDVLTASIGYDGIIAEWEHEGGTSNVYVTFESNQSKNTTNTNPTDNPDIRYSARPQRDSEYLKAVNRGDMETAQRMVDEAAKEAGYTEHLYHGTNSDFTKVRLAKTRRTKRQRRRLRHLSCGESRDFCAVYATR